jgi:hypothetical protein
MRRLELGNALICEWARPCAAVVVYLFRGRALLVQVTHSLFTSIQKYCHINQEGNCYVLDVLN